MSSTMTGMSAASLALIDPRIQYVSWPQYRRACRCCDVINLWRQNHEIQVTG
jgi:hypothetical protein